MATPIDICGDGGLMKTILKEGTGDETPQSGDNVTVHYVGTLLDGSEFDSSRARNQPFTFKIGQGQVIKGWDKGVATMKKGEHAILQCRADYAYGKSGSPPKIPADATLNFDVELISWTSGEDISGDGRVTGKKVTEGEGWRNPKDGEECLISYKGFTSSGDVFVDEKEVWVTIGAGKVPKGVEKALLKMKKGAVWRIKCEPEYAYGDAGLPPHVAPNTPVEFEVSVPRWKEVVKIAGGAIKRIKLVDGEGYQCPNKFATVTVSVNGEPFRQVQLCRAELPDGVEQAILQMHKGEQDEIVVEPSHQDPETETVTDHAKSYTVTLQDFTKAKDSWEMTTDEKLSGSESFKESGTALFKESKYNTALKHYEHAEKFLDSETGFTTDEEKSKKAALVTAARLNMAACDLKLKKYTECISVCKKVLDKDPDNVKALYRLGCAYNASNDSPEAKKVLTHLVEVDSTNAAAKKELNDVIKKIKAQEQREKMIFASMFA